MRYDEYLPNGWPIASGTVEGACKNLIRDRFERSGMRWTTRPPKRSCKLRASLPLRRPQRLLAIPHQTRPTTPIPPRRMATRRSEVATPNSICQWNDATGRSQCRNSLSHGRYSAAVPFVTASANSRRFVASPERSSPGRTRRRRGRRTGEPGRVPAGPRPTCLGASLPMSPRRPRGFAGAAR